MDSLTTQARSDEGGRENRILLLAGEPGAAAVARVLAQELGAIVNVVPDCRSCQEILQRQEFALLLLEEALADENVEATDALCASAGTALVLHLSFGVANPDRILRQVRSALGHRRSQEAKARATVVHALQSELGASLSGLLLETQLALHKAGPEVAPFLARVVGLTESLCKQLRA